MIFLLQGRRFQSGSRYCSFFLGRRLVAGVLSWGAQRTRVRAYSTTIPKFCRHTHRQTGPSDHVRPCPKHSTAPRTARNVQPVTAMMVRCIEPRCRDLCRITQTVTRTCKGSGQRLPLTLAGTKYARWHKLCHALRDALTALHCSQDEAPFYDRGSQNTQENDSQEPVGDSYAHVWNEYVYRYIYILLYALLC